MSGEMKDKPLTITIECSKCTAPANAKCNDECKAVKSFILSFATSDKCEQVEKMIKKHIGRVLGRTVDGNDSLEITVKDKNQEVTINWLLFPDATNKTYCVQVIPSSNIPF